MRHDWRLWLITIAILAGLGLLVAFDWRDDREPKCFPAPACRDIPVDDLR